MTPTPPAPSMASSPALFMASAASPRRGSRNWRCARKSRHWSGNLRPWQCAATIALSATQILDLRPLMPQAIADPAELRRFANGLKRFTGDLQAGLSALHGQLTALGDTWRDQEHEKFREEFEQTMHV